jgi:serine/threonine protein kinase
MLCPYCGFEGSIFDGKCTRCNSSIVKGNISSSYSDASLRELSNPYRLMRGDTLFHRRYRLVDQIALPETQRGQGAAWSAIDTQASNLQVVLREVIVPQEMAKISSVYEVVSNVAKRLQDLGQSPSFPKVIDLFNDRGAYFIVLLNPKGESLAALLKRQGGALPEPMVTEYCYQLCSLLSFLANQYPPIVHGSINPETIIIDEGEQRLSLIHLPLFQPKAPSIGTEKVSLAAYWAPEQLRGEIDAASDLYALAAVMYHAVTGYDPCERIASFHPPARRLNPAVTIQMERILARQLSLSKSQRYAHPSEMQEDLASLIASYPDSVNSELPKLVVDPVRLSEAELRDAREQIWNASLLNMGVFSAICVILLVGVLLIISLAVGK